MSHNESIIEEAAMTCFGESGYAIGPGPLRLSVRNITLMVQSYREYPALFAAAKGGQPVVAKLPDTTKFAKPLIAQIP